VLDIVMELLVIHLLQQPEVDSANSVSICSALLVLCRTAGPCSSCCRCWQLQTQHPLRTEAWTLCFDAANVRRLYSSRAGWSPDMPCCQALESCAECGVTCDRLADAFNAMRLVPSAYGILRRPLQACCRA
jgi:hypothetical protein